jgi:hypothetical protein
MYREGSGKISKLKKQFSTIVTTSTTHHDFSNLLLQTENLYTLRGVPPEQKTIGYFRVEVGNVNNFQSIM